MPENLKQILFLIFEDNKHSALKLLSAAGERRIPASLDFMMNFFDDDEKQFLVKHISECALVLKDISLYTSSFPQALDVIRSNPDTLEQLKWCNCLST